MQGSPCQSVAFTCDKILLIDPAAISAYECGIRNTYIFKYAEPYRRISLNYNLHNYASVQGHILGGIFQPPASVRCAYFDSTTFVMGLNLAYGLGMIVRSYDDNGRLYLVFLNSMRNVGKAATSEYMVAEIRWKDRRTPVKVLVAKTFYFVQ